MTMEEKRFSVRIDDKLLDKFDKYCTDEGQPSRNTGLVNLIEKAVEGEATVTNSQLLKQLNEAIQKNNELVAENTALLSFMLTTLGQVTLAAELDSKILSKLEESNVALLKQNDSKAITKSQFIKQLKDVVNDSIRSANEIENSKDEAPTVYHVDPTAVFNQPKKETYSYSPLFNESRIYAKADDIRKAKEEWKYNPSALGNGMDENENPVQFTKEQYERGEVQELASF